VVCWGTYEKPSGLTDGPVAPVPPERFTQISTESDRCGIEPGGAVLCWSQDVEACLLREPDCARIVTQLHRGVFVRISTGYFADCALKQDHSLACWSDWYHGGQPVGAPAGSFSDVAVGWSSVCALRLNGRVVCWGDDSNGQTHAPPGRFTQLTAARDFACGIRAGGSVACWGDDFVGQATPPAGRFTAIAASESFACGVRVGGRAVCWGDNTYGQLEVPAAPFAQVSVNSGNYCAVRTDGSLACWGAFGNVPLPQGRFTQVSAGGGFVCAIRTTGILACSWYPGTPFVPTPSGVFRQVSGGLDEACAVRTDASITCWGLFAQAKVPAGRFSQVSVGSGWKSYFACAVRLDGHLVCWGDGTGYGGGGPGGQLDPPPGEFTAVSAGSIQACALRRSGGIICWSSGEQLAGPFVELSQGCGLRTDHVIDCGWHRWSDYRQFSADFVGPGLCGVRLDGGIQCLGGIDVALPPADPEG